jgi:hypothetical protein
LQSRLTISAFRLIETARRPGLPALRVTVIQRGSVARPWMERRRMRFAAR